MSASGKMTFGDLPPSSSDTRFQITRRSPEDKFAYLGRTGEAYFVDVRVLGDGASRAGTEAGDDVDDTVGNSRFLDQFAQPERGE
jgi:hypothetical protein